MSKFDLKEKLDHALYDAYNIATEIKYALDFKTKSIIRKNLLFKNTHIGRRCFILGTGPSLSLLTDDNIEQLSKEITFGVNSLYKSKIASKVIPSYYALMDNLYWEALNGTFSEIANKYCENPPIFITDVRAKGVIDALPRDVSAMYIYSKKYPTKKMSAEIDKNIYAAMNVISYSILSALHMGFREIYLLGCDYNAFCTLGKGHCYDDKSEANDFNYDLAFYLKYYCITTEFHYLIAKLAKSMNVTILNLTPNSLLDAYPRGSIEEILQQHSAA